MPRRRVPHQDENRLLNNYQCRCYSRVKAIAKRSKIKDYMIPALRSRAHSLAKQRWFHGHDVE